MGFSGNEPRTIIGKVDKEIENGIYIKEGNSPGTWFLTKEDLANAGIAEINAGDMISFTLEPTGCGGGILKSLKKLTLSKIFVGYDSDAVENFYFPKSESETTTNKTAREKASYRDIVKQSRLVQFFLACEVIVTIIAICYFATNPGTEETALGAIFLTIVTVIILVVTVVIKKDSVICPLCKKVTSKFYAHCDHCREIST